MAKLQDQVNKRQQAADQTQQGANWSFNDSYFKAQSKFRTRQIDLEELGANRAGKIMFGKPIAVDGLKIYGDILEEGRLQWLMRTAEEVMFKHGNAIIVITKNSTGKISYSLCDPNFPNKVIRIGGVPYQAVIWRHVKIDRTKYYVKEIYDYKKVVRHIYTDLKQTTEVPLSEFNGNLPEDLQLPEVEDHDLGALPVVEFHRKPIWDYSRPTTARALHKLNLQDMLDETTSTLRLENENNRTRIILDQGYINGLSKVQQAQVAKSDIFFKLDGTGKDPKSGAALEVMQGDPKFSSYWENINNIIRIMLEVSGYSDLADGESTNPTATGAIFTKANDVETSNDLIKYRVEMIKHLLIKSKALKQGKQVNEQSLVDKKLVVTIFPNIIFNEMNMTETLIAQRNAGWIDDAEAASRLSGISVEEANEKIAELDPVEPANIELADNDDKVEGE